MKLITADMKLADAVHSNYLLIPVINRFGIKLGFGEPTVAAICNEKKIDVEFFLTILNVFSQPDYFPEQKLQTFNVMMIVEYLKKTHQYYREIQLPTIERRLDMLIERSPKLNDHLKLIKEFFNGYKNELLAHLRKEETVTFPYIEKIYRVYNSDDKSSFYDDLSDYSMDIYEEEHDEVDEKLYDLKNILIKYIHGNFDQVILSEIIFELFRLEKDIKDHTRIENNILMPLVADMENSLNVRK